MIRLTQMLYIARLTHFVDVALSINNHYVKKKKKKRILTSFTKGSIPCELGGSPLHHIQKVRPHVFTRHDLGRLALLKRSSTSTLDLNDLASARLDGSKGRSVLIFFN